MGRKPTAREKGADVRKLADEGLGPIEIAKKLGIHLWRILNSTPEAEAQMQGRVNAWKDRKGKDKNKAA
jgi:hypothetical protein